METGSRSDSLGTANRKGRKQRSSTYSNRATSRLYRRLPAAATMPSSAPRLRMPPLQRRSLEPRVHQFSQTLQRLVDKADRPWEAWLVSRRNHHEFGALLVVV